MAKRSVLGLTRSQHARVGKIVEESERSPRFVDDLPPPLAGVPGFCVPARTQTGGLTAKAGATCGYGNVKIYGMSEAGVLTLGDTQLRCWNIGKAVAANLDILVCFGGRGPWAVVEPCP